MKLKLDENLGNRGAATLRSAGHEVATVFEQALVTASDRKVIDVCAAEGRCLVTLDLDFANPLSFDPAAYSGIAVLRVPPMVSQAVLDELVRTLVAALATEDIAGKLWIVEPGRVRKYLPEESGSR